MTETGDAEFRTLLSRVQAFDRTLRAGFTDQELATLRSLLDRLVANATDDKATKGEL